MPNAAEMLDAVISFRCTTAERDAFLANVRSRRWTKDDLLRELIASVNDVFQLTPKPERPLIVREAWTVSDARPSRLSPETEFWLREEVARAIREAVAAVTPASYSRPVEQVLARQPRKKGPDSAGAGADRTAAKTPSFARGKAGTT